MVGDDGTLVEPLRALPLEQLRRRSSTKWRTYPDDVLPMFVAETDFPLAEPITERLRAAVDLGDTGYTPADPGIRGAYAEFARRRFGWEPDPDGMRTTCDVIMGVVELLRAVIEPGDRVIVNPPVYPPFYMAIDEAGGEAVDVPLRDTGQDWELDLDGIDAAFAAGARAVLLCNPHNPTGTVHSRESLIDLAAIADRHGGYVISDEIHAPLTHSSVPFTPFLSASEAAAHRGFAVVSASKAYNLAGLKCALMVAVADEPRTVLGSLSPEVEWRTSLFGALAGVAAFSEQSDPWLDSLLLAIDENRRLLADLLNEHIPEARYRIPDAGYLAWVDLRALGWGDNPASRILREARVAVHHGPLFGPGGAGHIRINLGCSPEILQAAVLRIAAIARD